MKQGNKGGIVVIVILIILVVVYAMGSCGSDHAPGYGQTDKCTICGKAATHHSTNYGYCDKHWEDAMNYAINNN